MINYARFIFPDMPAILKTEFRLTIHTTNRMISICLKKFWKPTEKGQPSLFGSWWAGFFFPKGTKNFYSHSSEESAVVGGVEVLCGILILVGLFTRIASVPTIFIMLIAIYSTKLTILLDTGLWDMLHAGRTDYAMLLGSIFLLLKGGGRWSIDARLTPPISKNTE